MDCPYLKKGKGRAKQVRGCKYCLPDFEKNKLHSKSK